MDIDDKKATGDTVVHTSSAPPSDEIGYVQDVALQKVKKISGTITVIVSGLALFSDGYNAQVM